MKEYSGHSEKRTAEWYYHAGQARQDAFIVQTCIKIIRQRNRTDRQEQGQNKSGVKAISKQCNTDK